MSDTQADIVISRDVFARRAEMKARGHDDFCRRARLCDDYYLGGGLQWREDDRAQLEAEGRPVHEINDIKPAVNAIGGYQIANRMDLAYLPIGRGTDETLAKVFSKYAKHCLDNTSYRDHETDVFMDGLIQQRGFFDMRMDYNTNTKGEIAICSLDCMDVAMDPDATGYDPDTWSDVITERWFTAREIEGLYGKEAADLALAHANQCGYRSTAQRDTTVPHAAFGNDHMANFAGYAYYGPGLSYRIAGDVVRYLVAERQSFEYTQSLTAEFPTGDIRVLDGLPREQIQNAIAQGAFVAKRRARRVRWETCLPDGVLFNEIAPYEHYTIVPFFPYFRRGRTRGMVDDAISPQDMTNKFLSQYAHIVNSTANSGYDVEEDQLVNMTVEELREQGSQTGLVLVRKKDTPPINKIQPNQIPQGVDRMIQFGIDGIRRATGVNESILGAGATDMSGVAIQSRQFAAQQQYAIPLWRLSQTRRLMAVRLQKLIQRFMIDERSVRIAEVDEFGIERQNTMAVNEVAEDGSVLNDLTAGEYDIAITEQPMQVTFDNSQFEQITSMRKDMGVAIPDSVVLRYSNLPDKEEIANAIKEQAASQVDPLVEAEAARKKAQAERETAQAGESTERAGLAKATAVAKTTEAMFSAARVAEVLAMNPSIAQTADILYRSSGGIDHDEAPIFEPPPPNSHVQAPPESTHPLTPDNPAAGLTTGLDALPPTANETAP